MTEDALRAMHQQFTATLEGLARQNVDLQAELAQNRQQAASELAALRQEVRAPLPRSQTTGVGLECSVQGVRWHSGATSAETDEGCCEGRKGDRADSECHDR